MIVQRVDCGLRELLMVMVSTVPWLLVRARVVHLLDVFELW